MRVWVKKGARGESSDADESELNVFDGSLKLHSTVLYVFETLS